MSGFCYVGGRINLNFSDPGQRGRNCNLRILIDRRYVSWVLNWICLWYVIGGFQYCNKIRIASGQGGLGAGGQLALHMAAVTSTCDGNQLSVAIPAATLCRWPVS